MRESQVGDRIPGLNEGIPGGDRTPGLDKGIFGCPEHQEPG
jgi:hypothetical protein